MKLGRLNHIGVATPSIEESISYYRDVMGAGRIRDPFEPLGEDSPIHGFLAKNPAGGQHHLCYEVEDIDEARSWFEGLGKRILGPTRIGAHGSPIFFLHPKDMMGQLTEIMETPKDDTHWSN